MVIQRCLNCLAENIQFGHFLTSLTRWLHTDEEWPLHIMKRKSFSLNWWMIWWVWRSFSLGILELKIPTFTGTLVTDGYNNERLRMYSCVLLIVNFMRCSYPRVPFHWHPPDPHSWWRLYTAWICQVASRSSYMLPVPGLWDRTRGCVDQTATSHWALVRSPAEECLTVLSCTAAI